ncbi:MerR family transcriptional regulator [Parasphingorhabdus sp.]|uniref:MerR family transcriptional regulator n=1 Tax=Parasphingorhabdus sp. TaxID=2709688 RepID=UPI003D28D9BB
MAVQSNSIGALSRETNVKVTTIRYYESIGLLEEPYRTASGRRTYGPDSFERLRFIRHARDLGFSVDTIRELIELQSHESEDCSHADELARRHLVDVQTRIGQLRSLEGELERMIEQCKGGSIENCAILESLSDHEHCTSNKHTKLDIMIGRKTIS